MFVLSSCVINVISMLPSTETDKIVEPIVVNLTGKDLSTVGYFGAVDVCSKTTVMLFLLFLARRWHQLLAVHFLNPQFDLLIFHRFVCVFLLVEDTSEAT